MTSLSFKTLCDLVLSEDTLDPDSIQDIAAEIKDILSHESDGLTPEDIFYQIYNTEHTDSPEKLSKISKVLSKLTDAGLIEQDYDGTYVLSDLEDAEDGLLNKETPTIEDPEFDDLDDEFGDEYDDNILINRKKASREDAKQDIDW